MKFKKLIFAASSIAVGSSLFGTVLTACSKSSVDDDLKIDIDAEGKFNKKASDKDTVFTYADAVKDALSRSTNWSTFKTALADEIIYRWYVDRAAESKDDTKKNTTFRVNLDEWKTQIDKDYDETVKSLKNKYGNEYKFYLQNQYLSVNGGTEASYKKIKLIEKVKSDFTSKVFATNYFGRKTADAEGEQAKYPIIYAKASTSIGEDALNNPAVWPELGFYARTNSSFLPAQSGITTDDLAKYPDGDYATIQNYVFDRWFKTEKPFFSSAALFKYSNPKYIETSQAEAKLNDIYSGTTTGVKVPDNPNEAFPFFGGYPTSETKKGTIAYKLWHDKLLKDGFATPYRDSDGNIQDSNGTISISTELTEDGQTCLLCYGSQMIGGTANTLYIPYANAAASLYMQMMGVAPEGAITKNFVPQSVIDEMFEQTTDYSTDNFLILSNFLYKELPTTGGANLESYLDLGKIYGSIYDGDYYHCPLFKENKSYKYLYGSTGSESGVRYVTNTIQTTLGKKDATEEYTQPWIFELNEAGMHAQTIDGYQYVKHMGALPEGEGKLAPQDALKNVLKYRLMQHKCGYDNKKISEDLFGESGKLKTYFSDNITNIILEMAMSDDITVNVFRPIATYSDTTKVEQEKILLYALTADAEHKFNFDTLKVYLNAVMDYEAKKKILDTFESSNTKIYAYRSKQIENAKTTKEHRTVYENGLLAPIPFAKEIVPSESENFNRFATANIVLLDISSTTPTIINTTRAQIKSTAEAIGKLQFVTDAAATSINTDTAFSPRISDAKNEGSNRFWYKSYIVDKMMYPYMSNKEGIANGIKGNTLKQYYESVFGDKTSALATNAYLRNAAAVTYCESKLFTSDHNYSNYGSKDDEGNVIIPKLIQAFDDQYEYKLALNGQFCDDYLNLATYHATLAYLMGSDLSFENFYKMMNAKISEDEAAFVAYVYKTNINTFADQADIIKSPTEDLTVTSSPATPVEGYNPYYLTANVNNMFDDTHYTEGKNPGEAEFNNAKISSDQYWHIIEKHVGDKADGKLNTLAGFTGLQTKSSNTLDSASGAQAAAIDKIAKASDGSLVLTDKDVAVTSEYKDMFYQYKDAEEEAANKLRYAENYGCWFSYAGTKTNSGDYITFEDVTYDTTTIKSSDFEWTNKAGQTVKSPALRLAKKIAEYENLDDLRSLAKSLGNLYYGDSEFRKIGDGEAVYNDINQLKIKMLSELPRKDHLENLKCFQRLTDVELHEDGSTAVAGKEHCFTDKGTTYKVILTQLNKADVTEKNFHPTYNATDKTWTANANAPITLEEFFYILCNMATESSVQQLAISEAIEKVYGSDKLVVYDAELYNLFDTTWIKDWKKKTIGA